MHLLWSLFCSAACSLLLLFLALCWRLGSRVCLGRRLVAPDPAGMQNVPAVVGRSDPRVLQPLTACWSNIRRCDSCLEAAELPYHFGGHPYQHALAAFFGRSRVQLASGLLLKKAQKFLLYSWCKSCRATVNF